MKKIRLSVAIATFNEQNNIVDCLEPLKGLADEIIVVDGNSSDLTEQLATKLGAKVITTKNREMFHINKNIAIDNCHGEWIMLLDADERISANLAKEIRDATSDSPIENGFWINRRNWFLGGFLTKGGAYPDPVIRLFRRTKGRLPEISVHEQVKIDGAVGHLNNDLIHLADPDFSRYLLRANRYTDRTADLLEAKKINKTFFNTIHYLVVKPIITFMDIYFKHGGFKDGFRGFIWALFSASHHFYAFSKYLTTHNHSNSFQ